MKCPHCGGDMPLEALTCPYCGRPNEAALQHARDMRQYQADYEKTRETVTAKARRSSAVTVKIAAIALLLLGIVMCFVVAGQAYSIAREEQEKDAVRHAAEYRREMDALLEQGDYSGFYGFIQNKGIGMYQDEFEDYSFLYRMCGQYRYVEEYLMRLVLPTRYQSYSRTVKMLSEQVQDFYEMLDPARYDVYRDTSEKTEEVLAEMREDMDALLLTYLYLTPEEAESLPTLSAGQLAVLVENGAEHYREVYDAD